METNIIEGNKLIGFFDGWKYSPKTEHPHLFPNGIWNKNGIGLAELNYHSDWNLLMGVVEKIQKIGYDTQMISYLGDNIFIISEGTPQGDGGKYVTNIVYFMDEVLINAVFIGITQFIHWFNNSKQ